MRMSTLAHYNVQDGSNMALIDPQIDDEHQEQDYSEYGKCSNTFLPVFK